MVIGRRTAAAAIFERSGRLLPIVLLLACVMFGILGVGPARAAADVYVLQDGTPLVSKPGIGGKILLWVDTGFPLRVIGREGEWLQVSSSRLKTRGASVWVPAARVGSHLPGTVGVAYSREGSSTVPEGESLLLEVAGSEGIGVHIGCRIVQPGKDDFIDLIDETPLNLDVGGPAADCLVRKLDDSGEIDVALRTAKGETVVTASTSAPHGAVHVRTDGPWGSAFESWLSRGFVFLPAIVFPPGNPVFPPGNPVPPLGSQMPALGNPVPALGNPVPPFQQSPVPSFQQSPVQPFHQSPMRAP